jgi:hypothetical protein
MKNSLIPTFLMIAFFISGCMHVGMGMHGKMGMVKSISIQKGEKCPFRQGRIKS